MIFKYILISLILFLAFPFILHSQHQNIKFEHISDKQGLSSADIKCILQDSKGFMWFGTIDGLNKYDGSQFTVYKYKRDDKNSLSNNTINAIYEDKNKRLWIATPQGLNLYNRELDIFKRIEATEDLNIEVMYGLENGNIFF